MKHSGRLPTLQAHRAKAELCRRSFFEFVQTFWSEIISEDPVYNWHIKYLCDVLQGYVMRVMQQRDKDGKVIKQREEKLTDLLINIPPGTTKSTICTVMMPAWAWVIDPTLRVMTGSYSQSLSTEHAIKSRDIIQSAKYRTYWPHLQLKLDQNNKTHYKNNYTGERYATSVGGTITGFHAHIIIIDDPLNAKEAASDAALETANNFMDQTLSTRKVNKAVTPTILVMQRLHANDPSGNWLKKKNKPVEHICLPATLNDSVKPVEVRDKYVNGLLDPVRLNEKVLAEAKVDLGSYGYAGQMMQNPAPEDGGIWQKWFIPVEDSVFPSPSELEAYGLDWDLAYTKDDNNAASAYVASGMMKGKMYIDAIDWRYFEFPELIKWMTSLYPVHYIEAKASGKSAKQTLTNSGIAAIEVSVGGGDKVARARMATPFAEAGLIYVRKSILDRLYNDEEQGILKFPNNAKKDLADSLAQAIQRHFNTVKRLIDFG